MPAKQRRINVDADGIDVVQQKRLQPGPLSQQVGEHAIAQQVRDLEPVPDRVQALERQVVDVVAAFARRSRPVDQGGVQALAYFLLALVEQLLRLLLPGKT